jgi:hypothetical protein
LKKFSKDTLLPVNTKKTKVMLFHSAVNPGYPKVFFENKMIEHVTTFKYLGVELRCKVGWGLYIQQRVAKIRNIYCALRKLFKRIPKNNIKNRRLLFLTFALPHFIWIITLWFFFSDKQRQDIGKVYYTGIRLTYCIWGWDEHTTMILNRERSI